MLQDLWAMLAGGRVTVPTLALCVVAAWGLWAATWGALFLVQSVAGLVRDRDLASLRRLWLGDALLALLLAVLGAALAAGAMWVMP